MMQCQVMKRSIDPAIWGPSGWKVVHALAAYAEVDPSVMSVFKHFYLLLPCPACQQNYQNHLKQLPIPSEPSKVLKWSYELHERVNQWKGKRSTLEYKDVQRIWRDHALTWGDVWVFLEAIVDAHAGANHVTQDYVNELRDFFGALRKILPMRVLKREELLYKSQLRMFLRELKKKNHISVKTPKFTCSSEVCQM